MKVNDASSIWDMLTPSQAEALAVLRDAERPLTVKQVGERLVCEGGSPSRLMRTLADKGLVDVEPGPDDRRTSVTRLTPEGTAAAALVGQVEQAMYARMGGSLDERSVASTVRLLRSVVGELPAGQALARRIADREPAKPLAHTS